MLLLLALPAVAAEPLSIDLDNGIDATIYPP